MKKEIIELEDIKKPPSPLNHVVRAGNFLFLSSQLSVDLKTHKILGGDIEFQTRQSLDNIKYLLESSNSSLDNVIKIVIYMRNIADFDLMNKIYREYFREGQEPARVTVQASSPLKDIDIEIEAVALINSCD